MWEEELGSQEGYEEPRVLPSQQMCERSYSSYKQAASCCYSYCNRHTTQPPEGSSGRWAWTGLTGDIKEKGQ